MSFTFGVSERDKRTLIVGASAVGALLIVSRGVPALQRWSETQVANAATVAEALARVRSAAISRGALRDTLSARRTRLAALDSGLFIGPTTSSIASGIASAVEEIADQNAIRVSTLQMRGDSVPVDGLLHASVRLAGTTDVAGLAGLLRDVEGGGALLAVRELTVSQPEPAGGDSKAEALRVDVVVEGMGAVRPATKP